MILETERLILRKPRLSDVKDLVDGVNNINISKRTGDIPHPYTTKDAKSFINLKIKEWKKKEKESYTFFIELKSEKKIIGCIDIININISNKTASTGSWINERYWKKGYITEAKIIANEFAFNKLKLRKLKSTIYVTNKASNATQQRIGYKLEGLLKKDSICKATGKIHDVNIYGLLKEEWKNKLPKLKKYLKNKIS